MTEVQPEYLAYLLRLWRVDGDGEPVWRASLESPGTGEQRAFAGLEALFEFLEEETGGLGPGAQPEVKSEPPEEGGGE